MKHIKIELPETIIGIQKVDCIYLDGGALFVEDACVFNALRDELQTNGVSTLSDYSEYHSAYRIQLVTPRLRRRCYKKLHFTENVNEFLLVKGETKVYTTFDSEEDM
jgi:hypothetical protein